jgi:hypothetical protein
MSKKDEYRRVLINMEDWEEFLLANSGLPGPRGNLELAQAVADEGSPELFEHYRSFHAGIAPANSPHEFLAFCGVLGLGRLLAEGQVGYLPELRFYANDRRWRTREAVAMALQRYGDADMPALIDAMQAWSTGTFLEQRAAAAALCEPRLLANLGQARQVLAILDSITGSILDHQDRRNEDLLVLRQGLGYCWSVAAVAAPAEGESLMEKWMTNPDEDIQWIMRENLKKNRLARLDPAWVTAWRERMGVKK